MTFEDDDGPTVEASWDHGEFTLYGKAGDGAPLDLLEQFDPGALADAIGGALPGGDRPIAAMFADDEGGVPSLMVRFSVSDVGLLHELRDFVMQGLLSGAAAAAVRKVVAPEGALTTALRLNMPLLRLRRRRRRRGASWRKSSSASRRTTPSSPSCTRRRSSASTS